jgi:hypothetical protein
MADAAWDSVAPCLDPAPAAPAAAEPSAAAAAALPPLLLPPFPPAVAATAHPAAAASNSEGDDASESECSTGSDLAVAAQPEESELECALLETPADPSPPAFPPGHKPKPERKLCGSFGCVLFDHHPGLCQVVLESGVRQRRPAAKLVQAVAEAPSRSPRAGPSRPAASAAASESDQPSSHVLSDSELLSLPCVAGCSPAVVAGSLALFRQWCPAATAGSDAESDAEDAIAHLEWAERSLTAEELSVLTRALEAEARRRLREARRAAAGGGAAGNTAGEGDEEEEEDCTASPSSDGDERGRRWASAAATRVARNGLSEPQAEPAVAVAAAVGSSHRHQFRAVQAKPGARVVVVYEEGTARVPYGGTVRQVHKGMGMLVQFDEDGCDGHATGEEVWVSEEHGDEWWYEPGHQPAVGRGRPIGRGGRGSAARAAAAGAAAAAAAAAATGAANIFGAPEDPAGTKRQKTLLARRQPTADVRAVGAAAGAPSVDEASAFIASSGVDALLARLEAKQAGH